MVRFRKVIGAKGFERCLGDGKVSEECLAQRSIESKEPTDVLEGCTFAKHIFAGGFGCRRIEVEIFVAVDYRVISLAGEHFRR